jgi:hypothetical protein
VTGGLFCFVGSWRAEPSSRRRGEKGARSSGKSKWAERQEERVVGKGGEWARGEVSGAVRVVQISGVREDWCRIDMMSQIGREMDADSRVRVDWT